MASTGSSPGSSPHSAAAGGVMRPIVVVGSVNQDLVLRCPHLPAAGETLIGQDLQRLAGGKGANQAVAAARLGAAVAMVGCVGHDPFGDAMHATLSNEGVDVRHLRRVSAPTGVAIVLVDEQGENCIALAPGANATMSTAHLDDAAELIASASMLLCQLEVPLVVVQRAITVACAAGVPVLLNPAPAPAQGLPAELLAQVDVLVLNEGEAAALVASPTGAQPDHKLVAASALPAADAAFRSTHDGLVTAGAYGVGAADATTVSAAGAAAAQLRLSVRRAVLITLGAKGVVMVTDGAPMHCAARKVRAVDTTGAGDTFVGALAAALVRDVPMAKAVDEAQRAAAFSVGREGAQASMPRRADL